MSVIVNHKQQAGAGGNSFTTIQTDTGTAPVATSSSDTLTITGPGEGLFGEGLRTVGNSATDTVTLSIIERIHWGPWFGGSFDLNGTSGFTARADGTFGTGLQNVELGIDNTNKMAGTVRSLTGGGVTGYGGFTWATKTTAFHMCRADGFAQAHWTRLYIDALSTSGERFVYWSGWGNSITGAQPVDGCYVRYSDDINSGKLQGVCVNSGAGTSTVDLGYTITADESFDCMIIIDDCQATTTVYFLLWTPAVNYWYVAGSITGANIPARGTTMGFGHFIAKSVGTTSRNIVTDHAFWRYGRERA